MAKKSNDLQQPLTDAARADAEAAIQSELGEAGAIAADREEIASLTTEVGLEEVSLDPDELDAIAADDTDDNLDADDDGVEDAADDEEVISDLPQELTQSYGTGLQGQPSDRAGRYSRRSNQRFYNEADPILTGGDIDANYEQANAVGDEAVGGTVSTPDQDVVDDVAAAVGLELDDRTDVRINAILEERDDRRWELDPKSSEDYEERRD